MPFKSLTTCFPLLFAFVLCGENLSAAERPNVILIITDDQGYGDLGVHGNPIVRTPNIDAMAARSAVLKSFYVSPVCTPTRASLMTGRYNYRTRAIDTYRGRAMMDPAEVTVAEILRDAGYATGIFGKWHLGDNYPMRAIDQGFQEALVHRGGGIGQPSDPPGGEGKYTDPILFHNGQATVTRGYCTDVYFNAGMQWAESALRKDQPFFLYLPTNAPHGPLDDLPPDKYDYYKRQNIAADRFPANAGQPLPNNLNSDTLARVYSMIENIDDNVGRLFAWLDRHKQTENTLVIFMTDNGEATAGYNAGLRGRKADIYDGGIRSPFFAQWTGRFKPGVASDRIAAHIDILPTLLDVCRCPLPANLKIDGRSLLPLLTQAAGNWPDRTLFFQSHRGDRPVEFHNFAVRRQRWKLAHNSGFGRERLPDGPLRLELFDMDADPFELKNVAADHPEVVADLKQKYEAWFQDVGSTRPDNFTPPPIYVGTSHENPVILTRQDWRGADWKPNDRGYWDVLVAAKGHYNVTLRFKPLTQATRLRVALGDQQVEQDVAANEGTATLSNLDWLAGPARLSAAPVKSDEKFDLMFIEVRRAE